MSYLETLACCVCVFLIYLFVVPEWSRRRFGERLAGPVGLVVAEGARWITPARPPLQPLHTTTTTTTSSTTKPLFAQFRAPNLSAEAVRSCALWCYSVQWGRGGGLSEGRRRIPTMSVGESWEWERFQTFKESLTHSAAARHPTTRLSPYGKPCHLATQFS